MRRAPTSERNEIAYYYPSPYWTSHQSEYVKTLLLFFDGVSILLPRYMGDIHRVVDETLAAPLEEQGYLHVLRPEEFVDQVAAEDLATSVVDLLTAGAFDDLPKADRFAELSRSRMGWSADAQLSDWLVEELVAKGLARRTEDGVSVPLHPVVRTTILVLLAQQARVTGLRMGMDLQPVTSHMEPLRDLVSVLTLEASPSAGHVVALDLETVSLDLAAVPLEDVLEFKAEHGPEFRSYARNLRTFVTELASLPPGERKFRIFDRQEELADAAHELRRTSRRRWLRPFGKAGLALAGAAWNLASHDPIGALVSGGAALLEAPDPRPVSAYSYLFHVERSYAAA